MKTYKPFTPISYATPEADKVNLTSRGVGFYAIMHHDRDTDGEGNPIKAHSHLAVDPQKSVDPAAIATKEFDPAMPDKPRTWVFGKHRDPKEVVQNNPAWLAHWVGYVTHYPPYLEKYPPRNENEGREVYDRADIVTNDPDRIAEAWQEMLEILSAEVDPMEDDPADCALRDKMAEAAEQGKTFGEVCRSLKIGAHTMPLMAKTYDLIKSEMADDSITPAEAVQYRLENSRLKEQNRRLQHDLDEALDRLRTYRTMQENPTIAPRLAALEADLAALRTKRDPDKFDFVDVGLDDLPF